MRDIELTGARVRLRGWRVDDAEKVWALVESQGRNIFGPPGEIASLEDAARWVTGEIAEQTSPERTKYRFALELVSDGTLIGGCRIHFEDVRNKMASIGMSLHRDYQGRGYGTEVGMLLLEMAFTQLDLHRIEAMIDPGNERSLALARRAGFVREGLLRERILEERWLDTEVHSLLEREWRAR